MDLSPGLQAIQVHAAGQYLPLAVAAVPGHGVGAGLALTVDEDDHPVGPAQAVVGIGWNTADGGRQLRLQSTFTDDWSRLDESSGELFKPPGYSLFDLYLTQKIGDRMSARIGLTNLTDKTYWVWSDVRGLSPDDPIIPYLARPGRSVTVSVDMNW